MISITFTTAAKAPAINFTLKLTTSTIAVGWIMALNFEEKARKITIIDNKLKPMFTIERINEILKNNS